MRNRVCTSFLLISQVWLTIIPRQEKLHNRKKGERAEKRETGFVGTREKKWRTLFNDLLITIVPWIYNTDFNADKVKLYDAVWRAMAEIYIDQPSFFWIHFNYGDKRRESPKWGKKKGHCQEAKGRKRTHKERVHSYPWKTQRDPSKFFECCGNRFKTW